MYMDNMETIVSIDGFDFIPYDDNNLEQILSGPTYGQLWGFEWESEMDLELVDVCKNNF
jgi:hypothetical protein